jgi:hypothetical protein
VDLAAGPVRAVPEVLVAGEHPGPQRVAVASVLLGQRRPGAVVVEFRAAQGAGRGVVVVSRKPSRPVTRPKCAACAQPFLARRKDARFCSGRCRQRAARARAASDDLAREVEAARRHYWALVRRAAEARGVELSQVVTEQAQSVDERGNVYMGGRLVGHVEPHRPGWSAWGLEAAGPPFSPPPSASPKNEPERIERVAAIRHRAAQRRAAASE